MIPKGNASVTSTFTNNFLVQSANYCWEMFCMQQVFGFMQQGFRKGQLIVKLPNHSVKTFTGEANTITERNTVVLVVRNYSFFVNLAIEGDIGMAKSYVAGNL